MLSCTASPALRVDRSAPDGCRALPEKILDRADGAPDRAELIRIEIPQEARDGLDAHGPPPRQGTQALRRGVHTHHTSITAVDHFARYAGSFHLANEPAHRRRADLFGRGEVAKRLRTAHEDRAFYPTRRDKWISAELAVSDITGQLG